MNDLLKILDMSEDEQDRWCALNTDRKSHESLADLAFRLRNEVIAGGLFRKMITIHEYCDKGCNKMYSHTMAGAQSWFIAQAKPIHWIIAALIAKDKEDG